MSAVRATRNFGEFSAEKLENIFSFAGVGPWANVHPVLGLTQEGGGF